MSCSIDLDFAKDRNLFGAALNVNVLVALDAVELTNQVLETSFLLDSQTEMAKRFRYEELDSFLVVDDSVV